MAISMTGFGRGEFKNDSYHFLVECKTINHKYCDINVRLPRKISFLEDKIRNYVKNFIKRGRVDLYIKLDLIGSEDVNLKFDDKLATQYVNILKEDEELYWNMLKEALDMTLKRLTEMRKAEGEKLAQDTLQRCEILNNLLNEVEKYSDTIVDEYREKLNTRINEILDNPSIIDENRLAQEVAIFADKSSITEEIVRFKSHIEQLKNTVVKNDSIGRKIDFLIQEMNREVNTTGSKSSNINITNLVVDIKSELEKIREQIQNIE